FGDSFSAFGSPFSPLGDSFLSFGRAFSTFGSARTAFGSPWLGSCYSQAEVQPAPVRRLDTINQARAWPSTILSGCSMTAVFSTTTLPRRNQQGYVWQK